MANQSIQDNGIGIINFLEHRSYFVTGATGFIGKVFIEKILRAAPKIHKIYVLIRANNGKAAMQRMEKEILESQVFNTLRQQHGESYYEYMKSKLVPVAGNLSEPKLGISNLDLAREIENEVVAIINIGGSTNWNERYDVALEVNVKGLSRFLNYALQWKKLAAFLYVSTVTVAFVGRGREGVFLEKPVYMPEEDGESKFGRPIDIDAELKLVSEFANHVPTNELSTRMTQLGIERAKIHGFTNTYLMTKTMGEMVITKCLKGKLSSIIIRPSFVECSLKEPYPGWTEGYRMMAPLILSYGKGQLKGIVGKPNAIVNLVPADITVNAMIVAMAKHAMSKDPRSYRQVNVYHVNKTILCQQLVKIWSNYFKSNPLRDSKGKEIKVNELKIFESINEFAAFMSTHENASISKQKFDKLLRMVSMYEPPMNKTNARFDTENTRKLTEEMSMEENKIFNVDVDSIDWEDYFFNVHIPGVRRYVLKETSPQARL